MKCTRLTPQRNNRMAKRSPKSCELVPESMDGSKSDAGQLELEEKAQDCPHPTLGGKPDSSSGGKSRHEKTSAEDGAASKSRAALSASNLKKNVGVVSTPESSNPGQDEVIATSMSSTDSQASRLGSATVQASSVAAPRTPVASACGISSASSNVEGNTAMVPDMDQKMPSNQNKHLHGAALDEVPKGAAEAAARMRDASVSRWDGRRVCPLERELGVGVRDEDGAVDLRRARQARIWNRSCCACHEWDPEVTMMPCGHGVLCRRCFLDPDFDRAFERCPLCGQQNMGITFSPSLLADLLRRSAK